MTLDTVAFWSLVFWWSVIAGCLCYGAIGLKRRVYRAYRLRWMRREFRRRLYRDMQQAGYGDHKPLWK